MNRAILLWALIMVIAITSLVAGMVYYLETSQRRRLFVSTTTSLYDTGLLDVVEEEFEEQYPIDLCLISLGTGEAIRKAKNGDVDAILVHAPSKELTFLTERYGVCRKIIAYNFFVIVGPAEDPVEIEGLNVKDALLKIVNAGRNGNIVWISRGDESGTHIKEKALWALAGLNWSLVSEEGWYVESGMGMGKVLLFADAKEAYTLSDVGTYLKYYKDNRIILKILVSGEKDLLNVYSVIAVNPERVQGVNFEDAITFIKFLISDECQDLIGNFKKEVYGQTLFYPAVRLLKENVNLAAVQWIRDFAFFNRTECPQEYRNNCSGLYEE